MVNTGSNEITETSTSSGLRPVSAVVASYVALTVATIITLIILASAAPRLATKDAWGHAVIVLVFAILLPLRLRAARKGSADALRALAIIASALLLVNAVEAALPHAFPGWMRVEMVAVVVLMAVLLSLLGRRIRRPRAMKVNLP
jgi:hypothetical protein